MELNYWEKQLILYIKGHFKRVDYDKDLKNFPANMYGLELEQVDKYNIFGMVIRLYQELVDNGHIKFTLEKFIVDIFKRSFFEREKRDEVKYDDILNQMLAEIQNIKVLNTGLDLGKPDTELFNKLQQEIEKERLSNILKSQAESFQ